MDLGFIHFQGVFDPLLESLPGDSRRPPLRPIQTVHLVITRACPGICFSLANARATAVQPGAIRGDPGPPFFCLL